MALSLALHRQASPSSPAPQGALFSPVAAGARAIAQQLGVALVIVMLLNAVGGVAHLFDPTGPFNLQSRADALQVRWTEMQVEGVPASELAALERELSSAQKSRVLGAGNAFWWPGAAVLVNGWQAQTDAIWARVLNSYRAGAVVAEDRLHHAFGVESLQARKERMAALTDASTPADFVALRADWDLETLLVPVDREIATAAGTASALVRQARVLGIASDPAPAVLLQAGSYALAAPMERTARAGHLLAAMTGLLRDLRARLRAAGTTRAGFGRAADAIGQASSWRVNVIGYQVQVAADLRTYATVTRVALFDLITADLDRLGAAAHAATEAAIARSVRLIGGVHFYYQAHALSCEETAVSMGLTHQGLFVSQDQILARLGVDNTPAHLVNGIVVRWGDPDKAFVGNVNGSENNYSGQQANPKALIRVLNSFGAHVVEWSEPGVTSQVITALEIYKQVALGHPVVAYATWDWRWHRVYYYTSEDGNQVPLISPANDHVYVVVGVSPAGVQVNDPIRGQYWVSKATFQASYEFGMAIVLA